MLHSEEPKENSEFTRFMPVKSDVVEETSSDEGWQEANSKGRSGNTSNRKFGRRRPLIAKLKINNSENDVIREANYRNDLTPLQKGTSRITSASSASPRQSKARNFTSVENSVNHPTKASVSKIFSPPAALCSLASKSISYKEVALAPPGTVLKPILEKAEMDSIKAENEKCNIIEESCQNSIVEAVSEHDKKGLCGTDNQQEETASELEEVSLSSDHSKPSETNGSKLSAAAEPFNPGMLQFMPHHLNSVAVTSIYDANASQGMLVEPLVPPVAARVPCGPRSPLYYRTNYTFRMKHGYTKNHSPIRERSGFGAPRIMNPHAPEFVPQRASQMAKNYNLDEKLVEDVKDSSPKRCISESEKSELARQILLSLLVKSAQKNFDHADEKRENPENSCDVIAKDSAIIRILHGKEEKNGSEEQEKVDVSNKNNGDGEGFIVVTKRRNKQKFTNAVTGLYNQQSILASVR